MGRMSVEFVSEERFPEGIFHAECSGWGCLRKLSGVVYRFPCRITSLHV